jgi:hypothetical protein
MKQLLTFSVLCLPAAIALGGILCADEGPGFPLLGTIKPRPAREIASSTWSIGGETLDRDFAAYDNYRQFLGPLGAKAIRLQAGWAKCEKKPGVYDWAWLDAIVDDARAQGVQPWLETSYGNPIYEGGGGTGLGGGFPRSPEALAAWDNWVRVLVRHFKDRVTEWEIWNEPDRSNKPETYASLFIRTASILRAEQPTARIYALALAGNFKYAESFLQHLQAAGKADLMDAITYHGYPKNPDDTRGGDTIRALLAKYAPKATARQGETGAPSKFQPAFALAKIPFSEVTQAKWDLRRMLAHRAKGIPFNLFTLMDMHYLRDGKVIMNWKGLLESRPDKTVDHAKLAYFAAQRVFAVFDDTLQCVADFKPGGSMEGLAIDAYRTKAGGTIVAVWSKAAPPADSNATTPVDLTLPGVALTEPVYADLLTGKVYAIPRDRWTSDGASTSLKQLPVYDSPVLIADKAAIPLSGK